MAGAGADNRASGDLETGTGDKDNSACLGVPQEAMVRSCHKTNENCNVKGVPNVLLQKTHVYPRNLHSGEGFIPRAVIKCASISTVYQKFHSLSLSLTLSEFRKSISLILIL